MKNFKYLIILFICLFAYNVKADMGPPIIARHEVMVTNKNGAKCYNSGNKKNITIPYGTTFTIDTDLINGYISVDYEGTYCDVKSSDISSKTQKFDLNSEGVTEINPVKAVILAKGGLNMRKGPFVTFAKIMTIPEHATVKITHKSGDYWYYAEYNGNFGWITGMDGYFGYEGKEVLYNYEPVKIYSTYDKKSVVGKIPANTEITDYINLVSRSNGDIAHYVSYNGVVGYTEEMMYKTDDKGKIKLLKDYEVVNNFGELIKKLTPQELEYNMISKYNEFYFPEKKIKAYIPENLFEYVKKASPLIKKKGYIGEGIFGETKEEIKEEEKQEEEKVTENKDEKSSNTTDIIIICLLGGIFLALTALVIIKLVNNKKPKARINKIEHDEYNNKEV